MVCYKHGFTGGGKGTPEYMAWIRMRRRCENPECQDYLHYGGRGIKVCNRWLDFVVFLEDMGFRPSTKHSIGRIDNNGDYCPENCRWETIEQQNDNKRTTRRLTIDGETKTLSDWVKIAGIHQETLRGRLRRTKDVKKAVFKLVNEKLRVLRTTGICGRKSNTNV